MPNDELGNELPPVQQEQQLEPEASAEGEGDPLDKIEDVDTLRAEAKKFRGIAKRHQVKPPKEEAPKPTVEQPKGNFVTREDFARTATRKARDLSAQEVKDSWDDLLKIPLSGYDPLDETSIAANMAERYAIFSVRKPKGEAKADTTALTTSKVVQGTASAPASKSEKKEPPRFSMPKQPKEWYPSKS